MPQTGMHVQRFSRVLVQSHENAKYRKSSSKVFRAKVALRMTVSCGEKDTAVQNTLQSRIFFTPKNV
jgi:hypothetical protein